MSNFTFWYGGYSVRDVQWLVKALSELKSDMWDPRSPVVFCGTGWHHDIRDRALTSLLETLRDNTSARSLIIRNSDLDLKAQKSLTSVLMDNKHLQCITLHNVRNGSQPLTVPRDLFLNSSLLEVTLAGCTVSQAGVLAFGKWTRSTRRFKSLTLSKVQIIGGGVATFALALESSQNLQFLKLDSMSLGVDDAETILSALGRNISVTTLHMENMGFDYEVSDGLAKLLANNTNINELSLRKNSITGDCLQRVILDGLAHNKTLRKLFLSHNPVGDDGVTYLIKGLQRNSTLKDLALVECEIWQSGCRALMQALPSIRGLTRLSLDLNDVTDCLTEMVCALEKNVSLEHVLDSLPRLLYTERMMQTRSGPWCLVEMYLRMNKAKRRFLSESSFNPALVPMVFRRACHDPTILFHFLRRSPSLYITSSVPGISMAQSTSSCSNASCSKL